MLCSIAMMCKRTNNTDLMATEVLDELSENKQKVDFVL